MEANRLSMGNVPLDSDCTVDIERRIWPNYMEELIYRPLINGIDVGLYPKSIDVLEVYGLTLIYVGNDTAYNAKPSKQCHHICIMIDDLNSIV